MSFALYGFTGESVEQHPDCERSAFRVIPQVSGLSFLVVVSQSVPQRRIRCLTSKPRCNMWSISVCGRTKTHDEGVVVQTRQENSKGISWTGRTTTRSELDS